MKVAIDISPLKIGNFLQHKVRGTGFYLENLKRSLLEYYPDNQYLFFTRGEKLPKDINIVHYPYFEPFFKTLPFSKPAKTVVTVHDLTPLVFPKYFPPGVKGKLRWQMQKLSLRKADAIITDSHSSKYDIVKYIGVKENKVHVVYLSAGERFRKLEIGNWKLEIKKRYGLPDRFVLYVGDATWNKNLPRLVEAIKKTDASLVIVGKALSQTNFDKTNSWNKDLIKVQDIIKNQRGNMKNQIITLGFVPKEDLPLLYNMASVFTMPSLYEGFGLPVLEAMSCGCTVITSKKGSLPEVAGEASYYVDAYSVEDIAKGIKTLISNIKLQRLLSQKGLKQAKKFSWKKTVEETMKVYKSI